MRKVLYVVGKLSEADLDFLVRVGQRRALPVGTVLIQKGRAIDQIFSFLQPQTG